MSESKIEKAIIEASKSSSDLQKKIVFWTKVTAIAIILTLIATIIDLFK